MTTAKTIQAWREATGYTGPMTHRHHRECERWERERQELARFTKLPYANAHHGAHWAESYYCEECDESDYAQVHEGRDITPFWRDRFTEETICATCKAKRQAIHEHDCAVAINTRHECSCRAGDREATQ